MDSLFNLLLTINRGIKTSEHYLKEMGPTSSTLEKTVLASRELLGSFNAFEPIKIKDTEYSKLAKEAAKLVDFYGAYKNLVFWTSAFSKDSFDKKTFSKSLTNVLDKHKTSPHRSSLNTKVVAKNILDEILKAKEKYKAKEEIVAELQESLKKHEFSHAEREAILREVVIQQEERSVITKLNALCSTIESVGKSILHLHEWNIIKLSGIAASIGNKCPLFKIVISIGADTLLDLVGSIGIAFAIGEGIYKGINILLLYQTASGEEQKELAQELKKMGFELFTNTCSLAYTVLPIFLSLSPSVLVTLAILSHGTGIISLFI